MKRRGWPAAALLCATALMISAGSARAVEPQEAVGAFAYRQLGQALADMAGALANKSRQLDDLKAYAVACGDKPGCFVPAPEAKPADAAKPQ